MNVWFLGAGGALGVVWAIHTFIGGREIARPLVEADLIPVAKWTQYYCWHLVTITLAGLSLALIYAGVRPGAEDVGALAGLLAVAFGVYGLVLPRQAGMSYGAMPQGFLLLPPGIAALVGLV